jgi:hypothetical protein
LLSTLFIGAIIHADTEFQYRTIDDKDINSILEIWHNRDLSPKKVTVIVDEVVESSRLLIVEHTVFDNVHYGAILLPNSLRIRNMPVLVLPTGLNQANPNINIDNYVRSGYAQNEPFSNLIKIIPAFRGRVIHYKKKKYLASGDFCDAYDGATDDTIALVNVAASLFPEANFGQVLVYGASRGGNVGLLMAARDDRVNTVISDMAPVDFYREDLKEAYGEQYLCQFLRGKTLLQARERMLASSPLYFKPNINLQRAHIHHGAADEVVPVWNSEKVTAHLEKYNIKVSKHIYPECGHSGGCLYQKTQHSKHFRNAVRTFLENLGT